MATRMARIVVVGSVAVDHVVRLREPLRVGAHLEGREAERRLGGGAANVAVPLAGAGHAVTLLAALGDDEDGAWLAAQLEAHGLDPRGLARSRGPSTRSIILLDPEGERSAVNLTRCADPGLEERLEGVEADLLYVRSRAAGLASALARAGERMSVVAHVPPCDDGERPARVLVGSASDLPASCLDEPFAAARRVAGSGLEWMVVTRGAAGAQAFDGQRWIEVPAVPTRAVDTTGAGDAFAAGLVHALAAGEAMEPALQVASAWGAAAAGQDGSILSPQSVARLTARARDVEVVGPGER